MHLKAQELLAPCSWRSRHWQAARRLSRCAQVIADIGCVSRAWIIPGNEWISGCRLRGRLKSIVCLSVCLLGERSRTTVAMDAALGEPPAICPSANIMSARRRRRAWCWYCGRPARDAAAAATAGHPAPHTVPAAAPQQQQLRFLVSSPDIEIDPNTHGDRPTGQPTIQPCCVVVAKNAGPGPPSARARAAVRQAGLSRWSAASCSISESIARTGHGRGGR